MRKLILFLLLSLLLASTSYANKLHTSGYLVQTDHKSCGPIAVVNAVKSLGVDINVLSWYNRLYAVCRTSEIGTTSSNLERGINDILVNRNIRWNRTRIYNIKPIIHSLNNNSVVILSSKRFYQEKLYSHYFVITKHFDGKYITIGLYKSENPVHVVDTETIEKYLYKPYDYYIYMYTLIKD